MQNPRTQINNLDLIIDRGAATKNAIATLRLVEPFFVFSYLPKEGSRPSCLGEIVSHGSGKIEATLRGTEVAIAVEGGCHHANSYT